MLLCDRQPNLQNPLQSNFGRVCKGGCLQAGQKITVRLTKHDVHTSVFTAFLGGQGVNFLWDARNTKSIKIREKCDNS